MLTLGQERLERQAKVTRFRERENRNRETLLDQIERKTSTVAKDGDLVTTDFEKQLGTPLSSVEFTRRLQCMNKDLIVEPSNSDSTKAGIYIVRPRKQPDGSERVEKMFVCGMERGFMPERSVRHMRMQQMPNPDPLLKHTFMDVPVFSKETRGWRTVLARLLRVRLITQPQIDQHFPVNLHSRNWKVLTT